jgi:hypothetical protein
MTVIAGRDPAVDWLLDADEPLIRYRTLVDVLGERRDDARASDLRRAIPHGLIVRALLSGQEVDGGFGRHPYSKWTGGHWRLVSLMDLGAPPDLPRVREAIEPVFRWLTGRSHISNVPVIAGLARRCASQEGNALAVAVHFGMAGDERSRQLAESLIGWQWPDGGWNCDRRETAHHSSFHESLPPFRGLAAYARATADRAAADAADRAAEFFLRHRVAFSERTGRPIAAAAVRIHYPPYWRFDFLAGLRVLAEADRLADPRTSDALDLLESKRSDDGTWAAEAVHFRPPGARSQADVVDWGHGVPSEPVTLGAMLVLQAAGRVDGGDARGTGRRS